jgi:hypothetical protein
MIAPPPPPVATPQHRPEIHYRQSFSVNGTPVFAAVTNLTAAFLDDLGGLSAIMEDLA